MVDLEISDDFKQMEQPLIFEIYEISLQLFLTRLTSIAATK